MKRIWFSAGILLLIVFFCGVSTYRVNRICSDSEELLRQAETCMYLGDYVGAKNSVYYAQNCWNQHEGFLGLALRHTEKDDVDRLFPVLLEAIRHKEDTEFYFNHSELIAALKSLSRMEQPFYFNIL